MTRTVAVILDDEMAEIVNRIKDILGIKNTTELIRYCIKYTWRNIA